MSSSDNFSANEANCSSFLGTGWSFPPTFELADKQLLMSRSEHNINQSIELILQTPLGSRSLMPEFGCDLQSCLFRRFDASLEGEIIDIVESALLNFEPRIRVEQVTVTANTDANNVQQLEIDISYRVISTNNRFNHVFPFSLNEATNLVIKQG